MVIKNILLIRTHITLSAGGPVPPLGLLHIAGAIYKTWGNKYRIKIIDTGITPNPMAALAAALAEMAPEVVGFSTLSCEADLLNSMAALVKERNNDACIIVGGAHATLGKERLLENPHIDVAVIGEGDATITELLSALEGNADLGAVKGIAYRKQGVGALTPVRPLLEDLDSLAIPLAVWDLIDIYAYGNYPNWNGAQKEKYYLPAMSSRGCPFNCTFCRSKDNFGQRFRARSAESFVREMRALAEKYRISEIHFFDDVFNYNKQRVKDICALLNSAGPHWHLSFPNGLRADLIDEDLLISLKQAGTYKIHYGIESASPRIQAMIRKELNLEKALETIRLTVAKGIIASGYFILGFPTETRADMERTVEFALKSPLNNAYFFKFTDFLGYQQSVTGAAGNLHFLAPVQTAEVLLSEELNELILSAQKRFYLNAKRIVQGFLTAPRKYLYIRTLLQTYALILLAFMLQKLRVPPQPRNN